MTYEALRNTIQGSRVMYVNKIDEMVKNKVIDQKERQVLYYRNVDWSSLEEVSKHFGVTRERIRQIEAKAEEKIRGYESVEN